MSYDIAKYIALNTKENKIFVTCACNNVYPKTYEKVEFMKDKDMSFREKVIELLYHLKAGNIQSTENRIKYAQKKAFKGIELESEWYTKCFDNEYKYKVFGSVADKFLEYVNERNKKVVIYFTNKGQYVYKLHKRRAWLTDNKTFAQVLNHKKAYFVQQDYNNVEIFPV